MAMNNTHRINRQHIASGAYHALLISGLGVALAAVGVLFVGASHLAAFVNYLMLH